VSPLAWLGFLAAAAVGAPARYLLDGWVGSRTCGPFPWGTLTVNVSGCLLLGLLTGLALDHHLGATAGTIVGSGGIGAYTTFSTLSVDTVRLTEDGLVDQALANVVASFIVGLAAAAAGIALGLAW